jgi:hypothetical protein
MKKTKQKYLKLNKETVRQLQPTSLEMAVGGDFPHTRFTPCGTIICTSETGGCTVFGCVF